MCDGGGHADNLLGRVWCVTVRGGRHTGEGVVCDGGGEGAYWGWCGV